MPGFRVPRTFAGHAVGPDVRADLVYTLGLLDACGAGEVCDTAAAAAIARVLAPIDGAATHTFASYRVAETLARHGAFADNPLLDGLPAHARGAVAAACDSSAWCALLDQGKLPANYAAVLLRCEAARRTLGLPVDGAVLASLLERAERLVTRSPHGWHDDSPLGAGRYDIYTADLYLFLEPLLALPDVAERLAAPWRRGVASVLDLVASCGATNGAAFTWGRSTGALALCLTIELGALAVTGAHGGDGASTGTGEPAAARAFWLGRAAHAFAHCADWLEDGLVSAHRGRAPYSYRGPQRRLQMSLDVLGKLAWAAGALTRANGRAGVAAASGDDLFPAHDRLIELAAAPRAALWTHRSRSLAFVMPFVGCTLNDYLPAAQCPGLLEVPVEVELPVGVPFAVRSGATYAPGGAPATLVHQRGRLAVAWERWPKVGAWDSTASTPALAASRAVSFAVDGATLRARERLRFDELPDAVALQIAEPAGRRLRVAFASPQPHAVTTVATGGIKEYRSFWSELARVHQIDLEPAREIELAWSVAPVLRVASTAKGHHYDRCLYEPLTGLVEERQFPFEAFGDPERGRAAARAIDILHMHWPEWTSHDPEAHRAVLALLREERVRVVWTQHNLVPHSRDAALTELYDLWAAAADGVIHHSRAGEARVRGRYRFRPDALHAVIAHPHFGHLMTPASPDERRLTEDELGLRPCAIRLGVVGAPRPEKDVQLVLDAVAASPRDDLGLLVLSLDGERVPDDPRIRALPYENVARATYDRRLRAVDVLVFPIAPGELLTSGVVGDAIGAGLPALVSDWPFLAEALGDAGIAYGATSADLARCLAGLSTERLAHAARASVALQEASAHERVASATLAFLDRIGSAKL
jgi:glycosyltransferase involved in cell wall biosynthesis